MTAAERIADVNLVNRQVLRLSDPNLTDEQKKELQQQILACQDVLKERQK